MIFVFLLVERNTTGFNLRWTDRKLLYSIFNIQSVQLSFFKDETILSKKSVKFDVALFIN